MLERELVQGFYRLAVGTVFFCFSILCTREQSLPIDDDDALIAFSEVSLSL